MITRDLGTITLPAGRHELSIDGVSIPSGEELVKSIGVTVVPVDTKPATAT